MPATQTSKFQDSLCNPLQNFDCLNAGLADVDMRSILDQLPIAVALYDVEGHVEFCNEAFRSLYALSPDLNTARLSLAELLKHSGLAGTHAYLRLFQEYGAQGASGPASHPMQQLEQAWPDGRMFSISRRAMPQGGWLDVITDITYRHRAEATFRRMAIFDSLTGLPNRSQFEEKLAEAVARAGRGTPSAVLWIDLDRFKAVNDTLGHPIGDALLREVARRLKAGLRSDDLAARFGGDEFAIIIDGFQQPDDVILVANRVIADVSEPYVIRGHQILIGASIGIEFIWNDAISQDDIVRNADLALYHAKSEGKGRLAVYNICLHENLESRRLLEIELREALSANEFVLHYQPQICMSRGKVCGFEALVRWNAPHRGLVSPGQFISLCEETGLIAPLGAWILRRACEDALSLPNDITVAVNVSPIQFREPEFAEHVREVLAETGLDPHRLELEVTESVMITDSAGALEILNDLRSIGVHLSLDDFGTGFSSLSSLRQFPFDKVKIDQSFVRDLGKASDSLPIVQAVADMCSRLGITVLAEGVETSDQLNILKGLRCDGMQGYLFGRPVPFERAKALVSIPMFLKTGIE